MQNVTYMLANESIRKHSVGIYTTIYKLRYILKCRYTNIIHNNDKTQFVQKKSKERLPLRERSNVLQRCTFHLL